MKREAGQRPSWLQVLRPSRLTAPTKGEADLLLFLQPPGHRFLGSGTWLRRSARLASVSSCVRRAFLATYFAQSWYLRRAANSSHVYQEGRPRFERGSAGGRHSSTMTQRKNSGSEMATFLTERMAMICGLFT